MAKKDIPLDERQRALAEESLPLVRWTIQQYIACNEGVVGLGFEDLCQEGAVALCRAAVSYREGGVSFKTCRLGDHLRQYSASDAYRKITPECYCCRRQSVSAQADHP